MKYGQLPIDLGIHNIECNEMLFYQYLPIKLEGQINPLFEDRLSCFNGIIGAVCCDFVAVYGLDRFRDSYVYITAKKMYQVGGCSFNRGGYHADGFLTDDINYIWSDTNPTMFNASEFNLTLDDTISMAEMDKQALPENEVIYDNNTLLRLDQYQIHKVSESEQLTLRTFLKASFSRDKYDLLGNSVNRLLNYDWEYRQRKESRNIPQKINTF